MSVETTERRMARYRARVAAGCCYKHPDKPLFTKTMCEDCARKARELKRQNIKTKPRGSNRENAAKWDSAPWSLPKHQIAEIFGVTVAAVNAQWKKRNQEL